MAATVAADAGAEHGAWPASSEELVRALTAGSPVGAFVSDATGRCTYVNARWCELTGLSVAEALGDGWSHALHPDDRARVVREWDEASRDGRDSVVEYRFVRPDGSVSWVQGFASPLRADDGRLIGWAGSCIDVTARRRRERQQQLALEFGLRALHASTQADVRRAAVETLAGGLGADYASFQELGPEGQLVLRDGYGWREPISPRTPSPDSPAGRALASSEPVLVNAGSGNGVEFLEAHGVEASVAAVVAGDGRPFGVVSAHSRRSDVFTDDDLFFVRAVANSLSAALLREQSTESTRRLAAIVDSSYEAIIGRTTNGTVTSWNAAAERLFGYGAAEMLGASVADLLVDRSVLLPLNEQVRRGERIESRRVVCRRKDGREVHVELTLSPVTDETGAVVGVSTIARDISERLRAEEELRRSEARYRDLFENAGDLIATADLSGRLTRANAAFCRALGYTEPELVGRAVAELVPEEWHAQLDDARAQKLERSSGTTVYEHELIGRGGERIPVEVSSRLIVAEGKPVEIEAVCRDLRERRRAERALRESEERYRMVVESTDALIAVLDDEYRLVYSSPAVERVLGYGREDLLGGRPFDLVHPSDTDSARAALAGRLAAGETALVRLRAHDGQWVPLETAVTQLAGPVAGGGTLLVVARDVSARISVEQALRESEERFRTLFEFSPRGMDLTDRTGTILDANEALARLLGYARDELIGRTFADFTHPEDVDADLDLYHELVNGERESYDLEKRYIRADGATITVHLTAFAIAADAGRPRRLIGIIDDITEQRVLEEQLRQSQKMEAIGRLAGGIAHDFNNLLTGINGFAELGLAALGEHDGGGPLERALAGIGQAADQAAALTRQLLAFSRRQVLEPQLVPINALARDFVPLLERLLGEHVAVELALDDDVGCVNADPAQLRQVLMNLAVNARDSMPDGGTLTIETEQVDLDGAPTMQGPLSGRFVLLAVSDTGTGMTADALERVFEPFYTTKDASSGTGLGLATVLGIVEQSGGRISVYSEPGVGSTFKVYLPSQDAGDEPAAPQKQEATPGSERLLLVEDNENVRSFTTAALESLGYGVTSCATPLEALRLVRDGIDADVVLSDLVMPELDGRELVAQLLVSRPSLGVVLMSGYTDDAIAARGVADENLIFLQKPFTVGQLGEAIRQALERRTARAAQKG